MDKSTYACLARGRESRSPKSKKTKISLLPLTKPWSDGIRSPRRLLRQLKEIDRSYMKNLLSQKEYKKSTNLGH